MILLYLVAMGDAPRLSNRTSLQMLNFIERNMLYDDKTKEEQIPTPDENEWNAIIQQVQNNAEILQELAKNVAETQIEVVEPEKTAEIQETKEQIFAVAVKEIVFEKQQSVIVEEVRLKEKKTIKRRLLGFFRRSSFKTKQEM